MTIKYVSYPPRLRPPGPQNMSSTEQPIQFSSGDVVLAHWVSPDNVAMHLTVIGSGPPNQQDVNLFYVQAVIRVRRGHVTREDAWTWPCPGFIRRIVAEEAWLIARPISQQAGQPFQLGGSICEGVLPDDGYTSIIPGAVIPGGPQNWLYAPTGCKEFRAWELAAGGNIQFLNRTGDPAAPLAVGIIYPITNFNDWTPWPTATSGLYFWGGAGSPIAHVEFRT